MSILAGARSAPGLLAEGRVGELGERLRERLQGGARRVELSFGLRRDLATPFAPPEAKIPIAVREASESDAFLLFAAPQPDLPPQERRELAWRRKLFESGTPKCFVAVDERDGAPCYVQWLMGPLQNPTIQAMNAFPVLQPGEALLENAYTPVRYRGLGIMPAAMARIAERAADLDARFVLTFVGQENIASLKGCAKAGFAPYIVRRQTQYAFGSIQRLRFEPLPTEVALAPERGRGPERAQPSPHAAE
jgi:hypothetical protein